VLNAAPWAVDDVAPLTKRGNPRDAEAGVDIGFLAWL
jgi:hypothetical protein